MTLGFFVVPVVATAKASGGNVGDEPASTEDNCGPASPQVPSRGPPLCAARANRRPTARLARKGTVPPVCDPAPFTDDQERGGSEPPQLASPNALSVGRPTTITHRRFPIE